MVITAVRARPYLLATGVFVAVRLVGFAMLAILADNHDKPVFDLMKSWDGDWYLAIAENGYDNIPARFIDANGHHTTYGPLAFFPLYPWLIRVVAPVTGSNTLAAAMVVSFLAGCVAACGLFRIARMVDPRPKTGYALVALWAGLPMGITLSMAYTEALFTALAAWALIGVIERNWILAGLCCAAAGLVRPTANVLVIVVVVAALITVFRDGKSLWAWVAVVVAPAGLVGWWAYVANRTGSLTGWFDLERDGWNTKFDFGRETLKFVRDVVMSGNSVMETIDILVIFGAIVLAVLTVRSRIPWPLSAYGAGVVFFVVATAGINYARMRFLLPGFPVLIPVARGLANRKPGTAVAAIVAFVLFGAWFSAYSLTGWHFAI
ncbi:glycosyltransferase family 39 protein [Actinocrispum wychmicini]|uniref:Dolichyl-phosphate-mannose-protein mannosyltransferase n=1 Tax=Actinocrispum wychmicini TaxID=1213861 RepID=A0A4R2JZ52_9PSEU|nr:glycosyltransferase family 39 protein [Actinocrispum wychmicini]TCO62569.1 dolichyl-phosphate-mannose-protein mannosyltransferase [Actinocrispum wychmicini]